MVQCIIRRAGRFLNRQNEVIDPAQWMSEYCSVDVSASNAAEALKASAFLGLTAHLRTQERMLRL